MADIAECIGKLVAAGQITKAIGDEALEMFRRSKAKYSAALGPAGSDAEAALQAAKAMREKSAQLQNKIAAQVKTWRTIERRVIEDPRSGQWAVQAMDVKDTLRGHTKLDALQRERPDHPILSGPNVEGQTEDYTRQMFSMLGPEIEHFHAGFFTNQQALLSMNNFIRELFGEQTRDASAGAVAKGFNAVTKWAEQAAKNRGKIFEADENWRVFQPWYSRRVSQFDEAEFAKDFIDAVYSGGLKVRDREAFEREGVRRYVQTQGLTAALKRAYSDIMHEGGTTQPFSKAMRTFEFQPGKAGAAAWLKLQGKYGVGNEIIEAMDQHIRSMARELGILDVWGPTPDAAFEAAVRLARENPNKIGGVATPLETETVTRMTHNEVMGKGDPVASEALARFMSGARNVAGAGLLRNISLAIMPGDSVMTLLSLQHDGISGLGAFRQLFSGMSKEVARDLQISAHSYMDWSQHAWRRYGDQWNVVGFTRWLPRSVVRATGAHLWSTNLRASVEARYFATLAMERTKQWLDLNPALRDNFLGQFGFTEADWNKIRAPEPLRASNGAPFLDLPALSKEQPNLAQRLRVAASERGSYAAHMPDARTRAIANMGTRAGTPAGEMARMLTQFKQFALERMTTHIMRVLYEGSLGNRIYYGSLFVILSTLAGAISRQAETIVSGQNPHDMTDWKFWAESFALGGAGGIYGDLLDSALSGALSGHPSQAAGAALGPVAGLATDTFNAAVAPARYAAGGRGAVSQAFQIGKRWTPNTWYTRLAVDRIIWEQLQTLLDPDYRASFRRAAQNAQRHGKGGFWWNEGQVAPLSAPNIGTALGR